MKAFTSIALAVTALASQASAHYIFEVFSTGGTKYPVYQYIRKNYNYNSPVTDLTSNDLRCNAGGEEGNSTQTITMKAGDAFTFTADTAVYHDGPLSIYMAKAPAAAVDFDGSGQVWFKILDLGPTFAADGTSTWPLAQSYTANLPTALPSGDYLLRIQQLGIHNPWPAGIPQFYIECAQITVTNGGTGVPGPLVSIPGWITGTEPGYTVNIYSNFKNYTIPGPPVWSGGGVATPTTSYTAPGSPSSTSKAVVVPPTTTLATSTTSTTIAATSPTGATIPKYGQCGGSGWTGGTVCASGSTCTASNQYYSQCL